MTQEQTARDAVVLADKARLILALRAISTRLLWTMPEEELRQILYAGMDHKETTPEEVLAALSGA